MCRVFLQPRCVCVMIDDLGLLEETNVVKETNTTARL